MKYVFDYKREGQPGEISSLVLMSSSPRRRELLAFLRPQLASAQIDEEAIMEEYLQASSQGPFLDRAARACCQIARAKAGKGKEAKTLYLAADTMVILEDKVYGKPKDRAQAEAMLISYLGRTQDIVTAVSIRSQTYEETFYSLAMVKFTDPYPGLEGHIEAYLDQGTYMDKAGAYGIQDIDPALIDYIEGDPYTIIGLPVSELARRLARLDIGQVDPS